MRSKLTALFVIMSLLHKGRDTVCARYKIKFQYISLKSLFVH